mmetsp:Transcript_3701/g.7827  ORF Transcript_3701/g.7827 Transcript_3701/m.7827 type:complete len:80 (-) Transcript_3701:31-270(-)
MSSSRLFFLEDKDAQDFATGLRFENSCIIDQTNSFFVCWRFRINPYFVPSKRLIMKIEIVIVEEWLFSVCWEEEEWLQT